MDGVAEDANTDDDTPKVGSKQGDVKEGSATHAQDEGSQRVKEGEAHSVSNDPTDDLTIPGGVLDGVTVKDGSDDAVDAHAKEAEESQDMMDGVLGDEPLLEDVADAVEGGAEQTKQVAFNHVDAGPAVGAGDVVRGEQDAHAAAGDEDAEDLEQLVADAQQEEGDDDDADDGPKVEQLGGQQVGVAVGEHGEVVAEDVEKGHDEVLPAVVPGGAGVLAGAVAHEEDGRVDDGDEHVVEERLKGRDVGARLGEEAGKGVGGGDAQREDLPDGEDEPEVDGGKVAVPVDGSGFENGNSLTYGCVFLFLLVVLLRVILLLVVVILDGGARRGEVLVGSHDELT